ncbi:site-specific integrase [Xanthobacteraceae bacterium Astr-EGSB]|uniref:tyrosine-type recombinase/integrase n=1 Tax=Astrobacterium formosum TaxID=3069710 RepID=UPI0027AF2FD9|nr:site-specific integrase [Xanthobacteraceae bacterium Astr-EGSB]
MPRRAKGPRLWPQPARRDPSGKVIEQSVWCIRDGKRKISTGIGAGEAGPPAEAERALAEYIAGKATPRIRDRDPAAVEIASVVAIYTEDVVERHSRPKETGARLGRILDFFGSDTLDTLNKKRCLDYVAHRGHQAAARRELEDLRAAIRHHWEAGLCTALTPVVLPERGEARERWLTRKEAARLVAAAWRYRETQNRRATDRATRQHIARFVLVGLYTGTRAGAVVGAAMQPTPGHGWIDLENGVFYRRTAGMRRTKKRQPAVRLPPRLLAHVRRWHAKQASNRWLIEWNGEPVKRVNKAFRSACTAAGLGTDVTPHTLRHTAITWQAQRGVPVHEICGFFGVTREVFERVYGHHHPDYQQEAVNALNKDRPKLSGNLSGREPGSLLSNGRSGRI